MDNKVESTDQPLVESSSEIINDEIIQKQRKILYEQLSPGKRGRKPIKGRDKSELVDKGSIFDFITENGIKKYRCPHENCEKMFPSMSRVRRHYFTHTDVRPFKCLNAGCQKYFSRRDNMLQHYRSHCPKTPRKDRDY